MIYLAYDASIHGDWVSHYAVRLAANAADRQLQVIHVEEREADAAARDAGLRRIRHECNGAGVRCEVETRPRRASVANELLDAIPAGPDSIVVCGTRVRPQSLGFLSGTVSEQILRANRFPVIAIHVAQPSLLGVPRRVVVPLAGHPRGLNGVLPFLRLFAPDVTQLHMLLVKSVSRLWLRPISRDKVKRLRDAGETYLQQVEMELDVEPWLRDVAVDVAVAVSNHVAREIVNHANHTKARLILLGASERTWTQRLLGGEPIEAVLRSTSCDVAIYRGVR